MDLLGKLNQLRDARVLLTGHTGFKGSWLATWLTQLGAEVHGIGLDPATTPSLFEVADIGASLASDRRVDINDRTALGQAVDAIRPDIVLHLAAQAIVREGYTDPVGTFGTNTLGTVNLLDALRGKSVGAAVIVTTDKTYENREWLHPYRETDALGGRDPYSASKACAEIATQAMRASYPAELPPIATARAGNVIGGGDWAADRLIPDCMRAFADGRSVQLRNPSATRPWQHVLDPLAGYLMLVVALMNGDREAPGPWNFGPDVAGEDQVGSVAQRAARAWGAGATVEISPQADAPHEADILRLSSAKAFLALGWKPRWELDRAIIETVAWHRAHIDGKAMADFTRYQLEQWQDGV